MGAKPTSLDWFSTHGGYKRGLGATDNFDLTFVKEATGAVHPLVASEQDPWAPDEFQLLVQKQFCCLSSSSRR